MNVRDFCAPLKVEFKLENHPILVLIPVYAQIQIREVQIQIRESQNYVLIPLVE